jgi:hypothetical protein
LRLAVITAILHWLARDVEEIGGLFQIVTAINHAGVVRKLG